MTSNLPKEVLNPLNASQRYSLRMYPPSGKLTYFVDHYWVMRWDREDKEEFTCEVIPSPYINVTFMNEGARITGVTTGKYTYDLKGKGVIVGVKFNPGGFHPFYRQSIHMLTDKIISASTVFSEISESFNAEMLTLTDEKITPQLEKLLLAHKPVPNKNIELISKIINSLTIENNPTVHTIATQFGLSDRSLQELFHEFVGVGLKWIILRSRLIKATELALKLETPDWARIATDLGYSDQSHFVNDFKRIIGMPPAKYAMTVRSK